MLKRNIPIVLCAFCLLAFGLTGCREKSNFPDVFDVSGNTSAPDEEYAADGRADEDNSASKPKGNTPFLVRCPSSVAVGEPFYVEFVLNDADGSDFTAPDFGDLNVVGGPSVSQSSSVQIINGKASSKSTSSYTFVLQATKEGSYTIPSASIVVDGKICQSRSLTVKAEGSGLSSNSGPQAQAGNGQADEDTRPQRKESSLSKSDIYFTAELSKKTVYEQEPIMLSYRVHLGPNVPLKKVVPLQRPELKGFWTQDIDLHRRIDGNTGICMQYLMFPQQTGKLVIPGISFNCEVVRQGNFNTIDAFFNGGGNMHQIVERSTDDVEVEVLPLPDKPAGFSGGVGHFDVKGELLTPNPKTNDVATLRITVSGIGNLNLVKAPLVQFPEDIDGYDPKMNDNTKISADGMTGDVFFDYTFVPRAVGQYEIPATPFIYFDTQKREYVTLNTDPIHLDVKKGKRSQEDVDAEMAMQRSDLKGIHTGDVATLCDEGLGADANWIGSFKYFLCLFGLFGLFGLAIRILRRRVLLGADEVGTRNRKARKKANKHLRQAEKALASDDHNAFYSALAQALRGYFADKLTRDAAALTNEGILAALAERGLEEELLVMAKTLLEDCDFARFAPAAEAGRREKDLERASELLNLIDQNIK